MDSTISRSISFETAIGEFLATASVVFQGAGYPEVHLEKKELKPILPEGMRVNHCRAALLSIINSEETTRISRLDFKISVKSGVSGELCTGEGLDAQEWTDNGNLVVVGTEDGEWLNRRLPDLHFEDPFAAVEYTPTSLQLTLDDLPNLKSLSFHFVIAENPDPEPAEDSAWYAVDQPHQNIQAA